MNHRTFPQTRILTFLLGPLFFTLSLLFIPGDFISPGANKVLAVAVWMVAWWITEAVSIPVTALLPLVLFPFLNIMKMGEATTPYASPIIFLFLGGFIIALALEKHKLHERIALNLIRLTGTSGNGIIMGFMMATAFLSMWISNTATAIMMMPIAISVINLIRKDQNLPLHQLNLQERNFAVGLMLTIGYAATLGGLATIIGTPPNVVFKGLLSKFYDQNLDFGTWMLVGVPLSFLLLLSTYTIITKLLFPNRIKKIEGSDELLRNKLQALGPINPNEKKVLSIFILTSFLWIFQKILNTYLFQYEVLNDTNIAMAGGLLMFVVPIDLGKKEFLLEWKDTQRMQWGILLLFGGGMCLAEGLQNAKIIETLGQWIAAGSSYSPWLMLALIVTGVLLSEVMSNVALVQIFVPVIFGISNTLEVNPILLAMPVTFSASIAFMFPIATPPNAIVFSTGYIRAKDMLYAGIFLNIASIIILLIGSLTLIRWVYE